MKLPVPCIALIVSYLTPAFAAETVTLQPASLKAIAIAGDAGAPTFALANVGSTYEVRARDFATGAIRNNVVYLRFDLLALDKNVVENANLKFTRLAGDTLTTGRFSLYGLNDAAGNAAQDWTAASFAYGAEFDPSMFYDAFASVGECPIRLSNVTDLSTQEVVSGNQATLNSPAFVSFLQSRVDAGGQATLILGMPSQGAANDKKVTYAFPGYTDPTLGVSLTVTYSPVPLPDPPDSFSLGGINFAANPTLTLDWGPVEGALTYHIYRRAAGEATPTLVATTTEPTYFDPDVTLFGIYYYSVDVITQNGQSVPSIEFEVRVIDSSLGIPAAPDGLRTVALTPTRIDLAWNAAPNALLYQLYRSATVDGAYSLLQTTGIPQAGDVDNLKGFRSYYYRVKTVSAGGISRYSDTLTVEPRFIAVAPPDRPRHLSSPSGTANSIDLTWDPAPNAQGYYVYRSSRDYSGAALVGIAESNSFTDFFAIYPQNKYYYSVRAVGEGGLSHHSHELEVASLLTNHRQVESLSRAPVAVPTAAGMLVSWRLLGTDPEGTGFRIYRDGKRLNHHPLRGATNFLDVEGLATSTYEIHTVLGLFELPGSETAAPVVNGYLGVPIQPPASGVTPDGQAYSYNANDASVADLDGDGVYELILKWDPSNSHDNADSGYTGNVFVDAYKLDGSLLWRIDLGRNIRAGAHYTQFLVYDFDGDGRAEMICKTADATVDGLGVAIGDTSVDYRDATGRVLSGPEFLTLFDGMTGAALDTIDYVPLRGNVVDWGDNYGNRVDRFNAGVAYLDGVRPSAFFARGYYAGQSGMGPGITAVATFGVRDEQLIEGWVFDTRVAGSQYIAQGNHQVRAADLDGDGRDEVVLGSLVLDDNGTVLYSNNLGHGDAMHVGDLDPTRPGLEMFSVKEDVSKPYQSVFTDAATGAVLWGAFNGKDTGRGLAADIDPNFAGSEAWGASNLSVWSAWGEVVGLKRPSINFAIWWDGDPLRELLDDIGIRKWDWTSETEVVVLNAVGAASNNGTKATPSLQADLLGDWREEVVLRSADNSELRIYTTNQPTELRIPTLMHDTQYRVAVATQNSGYNQPPHPSYFIGNNMPSVAVPKVFVQPVPDFLGIEEPNGNFTSPVLVVLNLNRSEPLQNQYRVDHGAWTLYTAPFMLTRRGTHTVAFRTLDANGGVLAESAESVTIGRGVHGHRGHHHWRHLAQRSLLRSHDWH